MDLAETVFNLRDINSSMQVIIVSDSGDASEGAIPKRALVRFVPNAKVMTMKELKAFGLIGWMLGDRGCFRAIS